MSKFIRFINHGVKHFFIIDGEYLGDGCNEFKNGLPDSFTDSQDVFCFLQDLQPKDQKPIKTILSYPPHIFFTCVTR